MADKRDKNSGSDEIWVQEFNSDSAQEFREQILFATRLGPSHPIIVYIDSYGGQVDALAKMIETMDEVQNPIITCCMGKAMSCGAILLSHGDARFCGPHSRVMVHEVSASTGGDVHDMNVDVSEAKRLNEHFLGLLAKNCNIKGGYKGLRSLIKQRDGRDLFLDADAALKFGLVDYIGLPKINAVTMHELNQAPQKISVEKRAALRAQRQKTDRKNK